MSETESTLFSFLPVFRKQGSTHDSNNGMGVRAQQDMSQFMCHDVGQPSRIEAAHEYGDIGAQSDATAYRPDAKASGLRCGLKRDHQRSRIFRYWVKGPVPFRRVREALLPGQLNICASEDFRDRVFGG